MTLASADAQQLLEFFPVESHHRFPVHQCHGGDHVAERSCVTVAATSGDSWNKRMVASPAAPAARHAAAFSKLTPPIASMGMRTARQTSASRSRPWGGP